MTTTLSTHLRTVLVSGAALALGCAGLLAAATPAGAMGSGNPYEDIQVGVSYSVYQPSFSAGLPTPHTASRGAACPSGTEENLYVSYGRKSTAQFSVNEGNPLCSDIGTGPTVQTFMIGSAKATLEAYCDPSSTTTCTRADVAKYGGHVSVTMPSSRAGMRPTMVTIETFGAHNLTAAQLVRIAKSLKPVM